MDDCKIYDNLMSFFCAPFPHQRFCLFSHIKHKNVAGLIENLRNKHLMHFAGNPLPLTQRTYHTSSSCILRLRFAPSQLWMLVLLATFTNSLDLPLVCPQDICVRWRRDPFNQNQDLWLSTKFEHWTQLLKQLTVCAPQNTHIVHKVHTVQGYDP